MRSRTPSETSCQTRILRYDGAAIKEAAQAIAQGLPVAIPTETVYGLAADATCATAVARIYTAKGRPSFNPLIIHVRDLDQAKQYGFFSPAAEAAAHYYWPGPLTIVVPGREPSPIAKLATAGLDTIALRCPAHPAMQALLHACGKPLAAPSANISGTISSTNAQHVMRTLAKRIPLIIDNGSTNQGIESTIISFKGESAILLRPGPIDFVDILRVSGAMTALHSGTIKAPGQMQSHYAPAKPLRLNARRPQAYEWMIGFGAIAGDDTLSVSGDLIEAAARLFDALHRAETSCKPRIAVAPVPTSGIGLAINDRLRRAAAPRR